MLGDTVHPCSQYLITPNKNNNSKAQKDFNYKLIQGYSFGILKQIFRQLYYYKLKDI